MGSLAAAVLLAVTMPAGVSAELVLRAVSWQLPTLRGVRPKGFETVNVWRQPAAVAVARKPRVMVTVANRGPKGADGTVLRYTVAGRMTRVGEAGREGTWTLPFYLSERRVAHVGANQVKDIPINDLVLDVFLKKSFRAGYWPDALKFQVMVEPRSGERLEQRILESTLIVAPK